ncbi:MAG: ABC transporter substrate-binding protein, partial [Chloroflexota bacterium]
MPLFVLLLIFSACGMPAPDPIQIPQAETVLATTKSAATDTPVPLPPRKLTICMAEEPQSLYLYNGRSDKAKWNVLDALYDGPIDRVGYQLQAVILEEIPDLAGGGLWLEAVAVQPGQEVVDANGRLTVLKKGVSVRPSGCQESACAVMWDGQGDFLMDRMLLEFKLIEGLFWSDGEALSADDSLFSFTLAADASTPVSKWAIDRSESYQALDAQTIKWTGKPGFLTADVDLFFWTPLPQHAWSGLSAEELLSSDLSNQQPLGWGPYMIETWTAGESLSLIKNPNYFRVGEGLPAFDILEYKFISSAAEGLEALGDGECDLLDSSFDLEAQIDTVLAAEADGDLSAYVQVGPQWEGI